jgi:cyclophilin family peptidyl-prolyl cis-trans isomerase
MKNLLTALTLLAFTFVGIEGCVGAKKNSHPVVVLETSEGNIELELFPEVAPKHVENFLALVNKGFYNNVIFHRVIDGFMIQGGDPTGTGMGDSGTKLQAEFNDSLHHAGTLSMARAQDPNSASCQFFICLAPQPRLDHQYTVFGKTVSGFDVVQKIGKTPTSGNLQRIMTDSTWQAELLKMKNDGAADVTVMSNGVVTPDRPLKKVVINKAYEKK